ncbi:hypothetical protein Q9L58_005152 [Maublancomyces gigas]|uniref:Lytic polysaccharide monooxygenase n=1 Tax=Discina gigas TaxID=1032678 RepID=A0ABR3GJ00_9PEZI
MRYSLAIAGALLSSVVSAHMYIVKPSPFRLKTNPFAAEPPDYNIMNPLWSNGTNFPCKGYHLDPEPTIAAVEEWAAGSEQSFTMDVGSAVHGGGSCQASISEDNGATFKVVKSYLGGCPISGASFKFNVPKETKTGRVLFAWTWFNNIGQREMYMNCAAITITGGGAGLSGLPEIFKANIGTQSPGCVTEENVDVQFPDPGLDTVTAPSAHLKLPPGDCGTASKYHNIATASVSVPATSASATPVPPTSSIPANSTHTAAESCMCSCGGPNGYIVNIMPAGPIGNIIQNATSAIAAAPSSPSAPRYRFRH